MHKRLISSLRLERRKAGLTQPELAKVVGYGSEIPVSAHERFDTFPVLLMALGYEAVFGVHISDLFPELYATVKHGIELRLAELKEELEAMGASGRDAHAIARKLQWLSERDPAR